MKPIRASVGRPVVALVAAGTALVGSAVVASAAGGSHTQTFTDHFHGQQQAVVGNPCSGNPIVLNESTNSVEHVTYFVDSDESWVTFTEEDSFTGTDTGTGVVYTGHSTFRGNANANRQNSNSTFTGTIHASGSGGSSITYHGVGHITMLPDGNVAVSFDRPILTCG
jgi:hypothetical protein